jgi:hypothetical protein
MPDPDRLQQLVLDQVELMLKIGRRAAKPRAAKPTDRTATA